MTRSTTAGRHRAPSRISSALADGRYSATSTFSVAASGGILASSVLLAAVHTQDDLDAAVAQFEPAALPADDAAAGPDARPEAPATGTGFGLHAAAAVATTNHQLAKGTGTVTLPASLSRFTEAIDRPAEAVAAPADAEGAVAGSLGFVGVTPVVEEPEPEPVVEAAPAPAAEEPAAPAPEPEAAPATEERSSSTASASRSESREEAPVQSSGGGSGAIGWAMNNLGAPYVFGSASGGAYDCSGFIKAAYANAGVNLPHGSSAQYNATTRVSLDNIQPGDLLFYSRGGSIYHVAIYIGDGQVAHSLRDGSGFNGSKVGSMNYSPGLFAAGRP